MIDRDPLKLPEKAVMAGIRAYFNAFKIDFDANVGDDQKANTIVAFKAALRAFLREWL